ncbi:MAG: ankyrin repeat domain-containing protein [Planctomycetia bacterium]|nr:ankyrin repeat domain-containing protein [Planctomycetia bacterium]
MIRKCVSKVRRLGVALVLAISFLGTGTSFFALAQEVESEDWLEIPNRRRVSQTPAATLVGVDLRDLPAVQKCLSAGADANEIYEEEDWSDLSWHPKCVLLEAIREGTPEVVECLLANGGDVRKRVFPSESCLELAAQRGNLRILQALLEHGGSELLHSRDHLGNTLLFETTSPEIARFLVANGLDIYATNHQGETAFHRAARFFPRSKSLLEFYLDEMGVPIDYADAEGESILWCVLNSDRSNCAELREFLFARNIDVHHRNLRGETILFQAGRHHGTLPFFECLIEKGCDLNVCACDGRTLLHEAVRVGNLSLVQRLLEEGLRVDAKTLEGKIPLDYARELEIVVCLLENGSSVSMEWAASLYYREEIWGYLIENQYLSANDLWMELMGNEWRKPVTRYAKWQMHALSTLGADVNIVDSTGASAAWLHPSEEGWLAACLEVGMDLGRGIPRSKDDPLFRTYFYTAPKTLLESALERKDFYGIWALIALGINELDAIPYQHYWANRSYCTDKNAIKRVFRRGVMDCAHWDEARRSCAFNLAKIVEEREFFEYLIDNGLDINANICGEPPLCRAVGNRNFEAAKILLEKGAYVNGVGVGGEFPIILARQWGDGEDEEIVALLLEFGAYDISLEMWKKIRDEAKKMEKYSQKSAPPS